MMPLTDEENKSYEEQKVCYICKKIVMMMMMAAIISIKK